MRLSSLFGTTLRSEAVNTGIVGHDMLIRAGYVRLLPYGGWHYFPLGKRLTNTLKINIAHQLGSLSATEVSIHPSLQGQLPYASEMELINQEVNSYRQLPLVIWQERDGDESSAPHGPGLYESSNPHLIEAWMICSSESELTEQVAKLHELSTTFLQQTQLPVHRIKGVSDIPGTKQQLLISYENSNGPLKYCEQEGQLASLDFVKSQSVAIESQAAQPLERVHTPTTKTIKDLSAFLEIDPSQTAKIVFYSAQTIHQSQPQLLIVVVRGDHEVNEAKVRQKIGAYSLEPADEEQMSKIGAVAGFASPIGIHREGTLLLVDEVVAKQNNLVAGANEQDYHFLNTCYGRDYEADHVGDFRKSQPESIVQGVELVRIEEIGPGWSTFMDTTFMSSQGKPEPIHLGYCRWHISNILAAIAEQFVDEQGINWPTGLVPYQVMLISLADGEETIQVANDLYNQIQAAGFKVLYDDRHKKVAGPGVKFTDADLRGIPIRITVAKRALKQGGVEWKMGNEEKEILVREILMKRLLKIHEKNQSL